MKDKIGVAFVCHGNICRSPMAQYIFANLVHMYRLDNYFKIDSMATSQEELGNGIYPYARRELDAHNIKGYEHHRAKQFSRYDYDAFDYILVMDEMNLYNLKRIIGTDSSNKVFKLLDFTDSKGDIEDPWYTRNFEKVYNQIDNGCKCLLECLRNKYKIGE